MVAPTSQQAIPPLGSWDLVPPSPQKKNKNNFELNHEKPKDSPTYCQSTLAVSLIEKQGGVLAAVTADVH